MPHLPENAYAVNLCEDRYLFTVAFAAVASRGQACLLPTSRIDADVENAKHLFPNSYRLRDDALASWIGDRDAQDGALSLPPIPTDQIVAVPFTSGSTGPSQPHPKRWGELVEGARLAERRFGFAAQDITAIVATVPPQHMYGFETSVMLPLVIGIGVHAARPFFPDDVRQALADSAPRPVLVTTPVHLAACVDLTLTWPPIAFVISATAPLPADLAARAERTFAAPVLEIYGFTEAGSIASRRTVNETDWRLYDSMTIRDGSLVAPHLSGTVPINDTIELRSVERFALTGRSRDIVNIAGKRTSLAHLDHVLRGIDGIEDGVFIIPDESSGRRTRLAAAVVAPLLSRRDILTALMGLIDPLFLPRPLIIVDRLPRNACGKLLRHALLDLLHGHTGGRDRHR
ncbi:MAG: acyl-CoA synthetase [Rhodospirillales bacterium]|nr:acyl-CoA synthetase [Rhodospirillales bacterium]